MSTKLHKHIFIMLCVLFSTQVNAQKRRLYDINAWDFSSVIKEFKKKAPSSNVIGLTTSITEEYGFTEVNANYINSKIDSVVNSLGVKHPTRSRFVITAKLDTISFDNYAERYGIDMFSGRLRLIVVDVQDEKILSTFEYKLKSKTIGLDSCINKSLATVDFESEELNQFVKSSVDIIHKNYEVEIAEVWNRWNDYDKQISYFLSVPTNHVLYEKCLNRAAYLSMRKSEDQNKEYLDKATSEIGWFGNESEQKTIQRNKNAIKTLNKIPKWSVYYADACEEKERAKEYTLTSQQLQEKQNREMDEWFEEYTKQKIREAGGDPDPKPVKIQGNTEFGLFVIGVLTGAWIMSPPAVAAEPTVTIPLSVLRALLKY